MMSGNYYDWRFKTSPANVSVAMDDDNGIKHPDGSKCEAKSPETCPILRAAKKDDEADKLEGVATKKSMEAIRVGADPNQDEIVPVTMDDLPTFKETNSKYRKLRNEAYKQIIESGNGDGSYPLDNPSAKVRHKRPNGEMKDGFADGFSVSFQTTNGEGFNGGPQMSDDEYDRITDEICKATGSKAYVGVFGGIPEISFRVNTLEEAMAIAEKYNQVSIADNARIADDIWDDNTFPRNGKYDWKRNQTFKAGTKE